MKSHASLEQAELLIDLNRYSDAKKALQNYLPSDSENPYVYVLLGVCELNLMNLNAAEEALKRSLALFPENDYALFLYSKIYFQKENWSKARELTKSALEIDPNQALYYEGLARIEFNSGYHNRGQNSVLQGLKIDPNHPGLLEMKAMFHLSGIDQPKAFETLKQGLREDPQNPELLHLMGTYHLDKGNYEKAKELFRNALSNNPNSEEARMGLVEAQKASSWLFRIFYKYGFSQWEFNFSWRLLIWIVIGVKTVLLWGAFFILFILFTWYGDVFYNSFLRIGKTGRYLLSKSKIRQSNFFLIANSGILLIILAARLTELEIFWRVLMIGIMILFMGLAFFQSELKRQKFSVGVMSLILLALAICGIGVEDLTFHVLLCLFLLIVFGMLYSFRAIGN